MVNRQGNTNGIIFLDFDGVMDTAYYDLYLTKHGMAEKDKFGVVFDPDCVSNLAKIIEKTGADIVVNSTWKYYMSLADFHEMWKYRKLPGKVIGITPNVAGKRGAQIDAWLKEHPVDNYVIIDDLDANNFTSSQIPHLFVANPYTGLDEDTADRIIGFFGSENTDYEEVSNTFHPNGYSIRLSSELLLLVTCGLCLCKGAI